MSDVVVTFNEFAKAGAEEGLKAAIVQAMVRVRAQSVALAPVDTSTLKNSLMWRKGWGGDVFSFPQQEGGESTKQIDKPSGIEGVVGTAVEYGVYQEFGTRFMPAQPYLRPAVDAVRGSSAAAIAKEWGNDAMDREFKKRKTTRTTR